MWKMNLLAVVSVLTIIKASPTQPVLQIDRQRGCDLYSIKVHNEMVSPNDQHEYTGNSIQDFITGVVKSGIIDVIEEKINSSQSQRDCGIKNDVIHIQTIERSDKQVIIGQAIVQIKEAHNDTRLILYLYKQKLNQDDNMWNETLIFQELNYCDSLNLTTIYNHYVKEHNLEVYVTTDVLIEQLYNLVNESKYSEAETLSKFIYNYKDKSGCLVINKVVNKLVLDKNERVMTFAYKVFHNYQSAIQCFPKAFTHIFNESQVYIYNAVKNGVLTTLEKGRSRIYNIDCDINAYDEYKIQKFIPKWNATLNSILFYLKDNRGHQGGFCKSSSSKSDECRQIHLIPTGLFSYGDPLFCFYTYQRNQLVSLPCSPSSQRYLQVNRGYEECTSNESWIIEQKK